MMGQPAGARPTQGSLGKFAVRAAAAAVLEGSDCKPQSQYVLGLRAKNCRTEDVLDEEISVGTNSAGKVAYVGKWPPANIGLCTPHCSLLCTAADS